MALKSLIISAAIALMSAAALAEPVAVKAFTDWCFKAGQTAETARTNMEGTAGAPLPFDLTFWDTSLATAPDAPAHAERRCEVVFDGNFAEQAVMAVMLKMAQAPVFGTPTALPGPYGFTDSTVFIEARALLRGRVAVVEIGTLPGPQTFIRVDRLPAGFPGDGS